MDGRKQMHVLNIMLGLQPRLSIGEASRRLAKMEVILKNKSLKAYQTLNYSLVQEEISAWWELYF
jgi:hypothetical protein